MPSLFRATHAQKVGRSIVLWRHTMLPDDTYEEGFRPGATCREVAVIEREGYEGEEFDPIAQAVELLNREGAIEPSCMPWGENIGTVWVSCEVYEHPYTGAREEVTLHFEGWPFDQKREVLRRLFPKAEKHY